MRKILVLILALMVMLVGGVARAADEPAGDISDQTPVESGTTTAPNATATPDSYTQQMDASDAQSESSGTLLYAGCKQTYWNSASTNTSVQLKGCVQYSTVTKLKRLKIRVLGRSISTGAPYTIHVWWSQDPRGHVATYRMLYYQGGSGWWTYAFSNVRAPALNTTNTVAYSQWGRNFSTNVQIMGALRNLGITLHGGIYAHPYSLNTYQVTDGGTI